MELFGVTLLINFPLKKSDFLALFKNVLTEFYCVYLYLFIYLLTGAVIARDQILAVGG
jgi:hypothetical protein